MAFSNFWRGDRRGFGGERSQERWRSDEDWRDREQQARREHEQRGGGREGWSPGGEYYSDRSERGSAYGTESYRSDRYRDPAQRADERGSREWRDWEEQDRSSRYAQRDWGDDYRGGREFERGAGSPEHADYGRALQSGRFERDRELYGRDQEASWQRTSDYGIGQAGGQYRGRGPRGYRRSDERIREDICDCLTDDAQIDATNLEILVQEGEVTLSGTLGSRAEKRRTEDLCAAVSGVKDVHNNVRVASQQWGTEQQRGSESGAGQLSSGQSSAGQRGSETGAGQKTEPGAAQTSRH